MLDYRFYNCDNLETLSKLKDESIDVICTDPPWLYLKNQVLEREFDEDLFFSECKRVLKEGGFIILFGRGTSFYRWNMKLADLGFNFKEEVIWNKRMTSSPILPLSRVHETISIHCKGKGKIIKNKIPYVKMKQYDLDSIIVDINRIKRALNNEKILESLKKFLETGIKATYESNQKSKWNVTKQTGNDVEKQVTLMNSIENGLTEKSIIEPNIKMNEVSEVTYLNVIENGLREKSIIDETRDHYDSIHPTQKPVDLMIRLLNLVCLEGAIVFDPFAGSGVTIKACLKTNRFGIGCEIHKPYFDTAAASIEKFIESENLAQLKLF